MADVLEGSERTAWLQPDRIVSDVIAPLVAMARAARRAKADGGAGAGTAAVDGPVVADVGAGAGGMAIRIGRALPDATVLALEPQPALADVLVERVAAAGLHNVVPSTGGGGQGVAVPADVVLMLDVYHHLTDRVRYLRALRQRDVRAGGFVVVVGALPLPSLLRLPTHRRELWHRVRSSARV
jgi:SAM-dependent methyltransferase